MNNQIPKLLFRKRPYLSTADLYINRSGLYFPQTGNEPIPCLAGSWSYGHGSECREGYMDDGTWVPEEGCDPGYYCRAGRCLPSVPEDWDGTGFGIGSYPCGYSDNVIDPFGANPHVNSEKPPVDLHDSTVENWNISYSGQYTAPVYFWSPGDRRAYDGLVAAIGGAFAALIGGSGYGFWGWVGGCVAAGGPVSLLQDELDALQEKYTAPVYNYTLECGI